MANGYFGGGDGSYENPYLVEDATDFQAMDGITSYNDSVTFPYAFFKQTKDISLAGFTDSIGNKLISTSRYSGTSIFYGTYNGNGFSLLDVDEQGLFNGRGCAFENVTIYCNIPSSSGWGYGGILLNDARYCYFKNCKVYGYLNLTANNMWGGMGALAGDVRDCSFYDCSADIVFHGHYVAGGLVGRSDNSYYEKCFVTGTIHGNNIGGLVGGSYSDEFINCYTQVELIPIDELEYNEIGGFAGYSSFSDIAFCYSAAIVPNGTGTESLIGGFIGNEIYSNYARSCYYDSDLSGYTGTKNALPRTTEQMKMRSTFQGWDFGSVWGINENESYPYLIDGKRTQCKSIVMTKLLV